MSIKTYESAVNHRMKKSNEPISVEKPNSTIEEVFLSEETPLLKFAFGYVKRRELAEEIVQDAFVKLHEQWEKVEQPRPWLYKAVRNLALNSIRKLKRETLTDELGDAVDESKNDEVVRLEAVHTMRMLMADLGDKDRELVRLKFEEDQSYSHISEKLEMGVGNVGYRLHHVLKQLAEGLRRKGIDSY